MADTTDTSSASYFQELPVAAIVYSNLLSTRLHGPSRLNHVRNKASYGLTALLVAVSLFGLFQIGSLVLTELSSGDGSRTSAVSSATAAPVSEKQHPATGFLPKSAPTRLEIPSIGVNSAIVSVGLDDEGAMEVPDADVVGWYNLGPAPGQIGPAVINGHVDSALSGPAVFWDLEKLKPGDEVRISREDGKTVTFIVEKSDVYEQNNFPSDAVYGNLDYPGLRLITCDGDFNPLTHHYSHNLVVYAKAKL